MDSRAATRCLDDRRLVELAASPSVRDPHIDECAACRDRLAAFRGEAMAHGLAPTLATPASRPRSKRADDGTELEPGTRVGEYLVGEKIGAGGMGRVYAAIHPVIGKKAAIKVIAPHLCRDDDAVARFLQEARAVNAIGHPNIVDVFSVGTLPDGRSYLIMELLEGEPLAALMARERLALPDALALFDSVLAAVEAAHEKRIIHRDLKPDNVFLVARPGGGYAVKLLDFGIAKLQGPNSGTPGIRATTTGMLLGTPMYMPPEQATGREVTPAADVYALGGVFFEMLAGRPPFWADNAAELIASHLYSAPPKASLYHPEVPPGLDALLIEMLDKSPAARPSVSEVRARLRGDGARRPRAHGAVSLSPPPRQAPPAPRRRGPLAVALLAAVAALALGAIWLARSAGDEPSAAAATPPAADAAAEPAAPAPRPQPAPAAAPPAAAQGGVLVVAVAAPDARVEIDGLEVASTEEGARVEYVSDGVHDVAVSAPGYRPQKTSVAVRGGATVQVPMALLHLRERSRHRRHAVATDAPAARAKPAKATAKKPPSETHATPDRDAPIDDPFAESHP